jgi:hypothetical protein
MPMPSRPISSMSTISDCRTTTSKITIQMTLFHLADLSPLNSLSRGVVERIAFTYKNLAVLTDVPDSLRLGAGVVRACLLKSS